MQMLETWKDDQTLEGISSVVEVQYYFQFDDLTIFR